jgi:hypothetical protein
MNVYINRNNPIRLVLYYGDPLVPVPNGAVTRAIFRFGRYCVDTDIPADPIELIENETQVRMFLGLISDLREGTYMGYLTIYDAEAPHGIGWGRAERVKVIPWPVCV